MTHRFGVEEAPRAYGLLTDDGDTHPLGIVLSYPSATSESAAAPAPSVTTSSRRPAASSVPLAKGQSVVVGFIGAGSFASSTLLPILKKHKDVRLRTVVTTQGVTALQAQRRFGFDRIGTDPDLVFADPDVHLVFIATRHDSHADLVMRALQAGKHVFVEKPLALNETDLAAVEAAAAVAPGMLLVGFNRRYSPDAQALRAAFADASPLMMTYRVNAGALPTAHWLNDPLVGGGRLIGEGCHFIDLMSFLAGDSELVLAEIRSAGGARNPVEDFTVELEFSDGSVGSLHYTARGASQFGKEYLEIHGGGKSAYLQDFRDGRLYSATSCVRLPGKGKGHVEQFTSILQSLREGGRSPIPLRVFLSITRATLMRREGMRT